MSTLVFYPHEDDSLKGTTEEKLETMLESAERYKAVLLDVGSAKIEGIGAATQKRVIPKDLVAAFNWDGIAKLLREIRELPETTAQIKNQKSGYLMKLAEIYEILRAAKMPKLEAVRLALINEANQIRGTTQVA